MRDQTGVWLDQNHAVIVRFANDEVNVSRLDTAPEKKRRATGGVKSGRPFWHRSVESSRRAEEHRRGTVRKFYAELAEAIAGDEHVTLIGPARGKTDFAGFLQEFAKKEPESVLSANARMTDRQVVAFFKTLFDRPDPRWTPRMSARA